MMKMGPKSSVQNERLPLAHNRRWFNSMLHNQIDELATMVAKQNETTENLTSLLNIVLKYLDISECYSDACDIESRAERNQK
jgi:hypothetical protein